MVHHLHPGFLSDAHEYESAERYWRELINRVARDQGQEGQWVPWMSKRFKNGSAFPRDGNPIYDARSETLGRAIQVIQWPPETPNSVEIAAWLQSFDFSESGGPGPTDELVLNLALSEESAAIARDLIGRWMDRRTSYEDMEMVARAVGQGA